jgi:hypothetical protein
MFGFPHLGAGQTFALNNAHTKEYGSDNGDGCTQETDRRWRTDRQWKINGVRLSVDLECSGNCVITFFTEYETLPVDAVIG